MGEVVTELAEPIEALFLGGRVVLSEPPNLTDPEYRELAKQLRLYADAIDPALDGIR